MTFAEMQTEVQKRLEEGVGGSHIYWTLAQQKTALNEGYEEITEHAEYIETSENVSLTANTTYYDLNALLTNLHAFIRVTRIFNNQTNRWLHPTDVRELDGIRRQWEDATGAPERWWIRGAWWLGLYPKPPSTTGSVKVFFSVNASLSDLSADGDVALIPPEYHLGIVEYACYDLLCQEREVEKALKYWAKFDRRGNLVGGYLYYAEGLARYARARDRYDRVLGYSG